MGLKIECDVEGCAGKATQCVEVRNEDNTDAERRYHCATHEVAEADFPEGWQPDELHYHPRHYEEPWPVLPLTIDDNGRVRFRENKIVQFLLDNGPNDMNSIAVGDFSPEDREHFAQLIGYSLDGFSELSYVSDKTYAAAVKAAAAAEVAVTLAHTEDQT